MAETKGRKLRYVGPHKAVTIAALDLTVERGKQVTIEDAAIAASLLDQEENWKEVGAGKQEAQKAGEEGS